VLNAKVDVSRLLKRFDSMKRRAGAKGLEAVFRELRDPMRKDQKEHADKREGPRGPWPDRAQSTKNRAKRRRRRTKGTGRTRPHVRRARKILGRLPRAIRVAARGVSVFAISRVKWAKVHQEGGVAGRGSLIPERQFLYVSPDLVEIAQGKMVQALREGWAEGAR
jgi:phage gpG-like protein